MNRTVVLSERLVISRSAQAGRVAIELAWASMGKADVEQSRQAERAAAALLGGEFRLGDNVGVAWVQYSLAESARMGVIMLGSATVVAFGVTIALAASNAPIAAAILGLITITCVLWARRLSRRIRTQTVRRRFCWFSGGVIQTHPDRPTRVLRWADVDSVTLTFNDADERFNGLSWCTLACDAGTTVSADGAYPKSVVREVTDLAERVLSPRIATALISAYDSGEPVIVDGRSIDRTGVTDNRSKRSRSVSWPEVREITIVSEDHGGVVDPPSLVGITPGTGRELRLSLSGTRNGLFLPRLMEHVAQHQQIPLRRITVRPGKGGS